MKAKTAYTILCFGMVLGMFTGCGAKEKEAEVMPGAKNNTELEMTDEASDDATDETADEASDKTLDKAAIEIMDEETPESDSETLNAVGMPLMDNTALLASVKAPGGWVSKQYEYDKEGHILRYLNVGGMWEYEYEYDSAGNMSRENVWRYNNDEWRETDRRLFEQTEFAYDGAGRLIGWIMREYSNDDGILDRCFVYASSGQQSWEMRYLFDADGNVAEQFRYEYDEMGNETLKVEYDAEGKLNLFEGYDCDTYVSFYPYWRSENTYDDFGNLLKTTVYGYEGDEVTYVKYTYDDDGHLIKEEGLDGDPIIGEYTDEYTYNEKGYLISTFSMTNTEIYGAEYEYDDNGNCVKKLNRYFERDEADNVSECSYSPSFWQENQYDERNRLIRVYYAYDNTTYDYTYETIGVADEDYPYDKIEIYGEIGERWSGGRIIEKELE